MKDFESGVAYLRKEALAAKLIEDSDNNDVLVEKLAGLIRNSVEVESVEDSGKKSKK